MDPARRFGDLSRPPLDGTGLRSALVRPGGLWSEVVVTSETTSTNADVARAARDGAPEGLVHTSDAQTAGRGRLDRAWTMPPGSGVIVSVLLRPPPQVATRRWVWLPLLVGLAVDATAHDCGVGTGLKWPNDVLVRDRKLAGILLERVEGPAGPAAVIGVGLNVTTAADELPVPTATSLLLEGADQVDRTVVLRSLLRNLESLYRAWVATAGDPRAGIRESYRRRCVTLGSVVDVSLPDGSTLHGTATDVDDDGRLVVEAASGAGPTALSAGDVTHVRLAGT